MFIKPTYFRIVFLLFLFPPKSPTLEKVAALLPLEIYGKNLALIFPVSVNAITTLDLFGVHLKDMISAVQCFPGAFVCSIT